MRRPSEIRPFWPSGLNVWVPLAILFAPSLDSLLFLFCNLCIHTHLEREKATSMLRSGFEVLNRVCMHESWDPKCKELVKLPRFVPEVSIMSSLEAFARRAFFFPLPGKTVRRRSERFSSPVPPEVALVLCFLLRHEVR